MGNFLDTPLKEFMIIIKGLLCRIQMFFLNDGVSKTMYANKTLSNKDTLMTVVATANVVNGKIIFNEENNILKRMLKCN